MKIRHDSERKEFYAPLDSGKAVLKYEQVNESTLDFYSTFVPEERRNEGIGADLVRHGLEYADSEDLKVIPSCPFVEAFLEQNPKYLRLRKETA